MRSIWILITVMALSACYWKDFHDDDEWEPERTPSGGPRPSLGPDCPQPSCPPASRATYLSADAETCRVIPFECPEGSEPFRSPCGCGCELTELRTEPNAGECPDGPDVLYLSETAKVCETVSFECPDGRERFDSECGCGCFSSCPDANDPRVHYLSQDRALCDAISFECPDACVPFDDRCGCGCIEPEVPVGACPDPDDPTVRYISTDPAVCDELTVSCPPDCRIFDDACGCGCIE